MNEQGPGSRYSGKTLAFGEVSGCFVLVQSARPVYKVFAPHELDDAMVYLDLPWSERQRAAELVADLKLRMNAAMT